MQSSSGRTVLVLCVVAIGTSLLGAVWLKRITDKLTAGSATVHSAPPHQLVRPRSPATVPAALAFRPIALTRTGGPAGTADHITITAGGLATVDGPTWGRRHGTLSRPVISSLATAFRMWGGLAADYPAPQPKAGSYTYQLSYGGKVVTTTNPGGAAPDAFWRAERLLERVARTVRRETDAVPPDARPPEGAPDAAQGN